MHDRIAIIEPVGGHGGMNYYDFGLARGLANAGCNVILYTCTETDLPNDATFTCVRSFHGIYGNAPKWLRGGRYVRDLLLSLLDAKKRGCKIVHFHFFHAGTMEALTMRIVRVIGLKTVLTVHDVESFAGEGSVVSARKIFGAADRLIAHNSVSRSELVNRLGIAPERIDIVPHGHYLAFVNNIPSREQSRMHLGLSDEMVLLFFGQIKQVKGLDVLLDALAIMKPNKNKLRLLIAGKVWKDDFKKYAEQIKKLGLVDIVQTDIRYIPDDQASVYYAASDLVVLPYRRIYQSGVLLMAMSYGRAVLTSDLPGMTEIVCDGKNGFLFKSEDAQSLADRLTMILHDPDSVVRVAEAGLKTACTDHDWNRIGRMTWESYNA